MSSSLEDQRSEIKTSIHGRRFGLDKDGFAVGAKGMRNAVSNATSGSTGTNLANHGVHTIAGSTDTFKLDDPAPGCRVSIIRNVASTSTASISPVAATIVSDNGIAGSAIALQGVGDAVILEGLSTSQWAVTSKTTGVSISS